MAAGGGMVAPPMAFMRASTDAASSPWLEALTAEAGGEAVRGVLTEAEAEAELLPLGSITCEMEETKLSFMSLKNLPAASTGDMARGCSLALFTLL